MALPARQQVIYWGAAALVFLFALWLLGGVLLPFIISGAIAYVLDPMADRLERMGMSRALATVTISLFALLAFVLLVLLVVPSLISQASGLVTTAPDMATRLTNWLTTQFPVLLDADSTIRKSLDQLGAELRSHGAALLNSVLTSAKSVVNVVLLFVLVPVITFYMLLDWDKMTAKIAGLLPRDHAPVIRELAFEINRTLASFVRGQGLVCLVLGTFYAVGLFLCGLQFGLVVGAIAGALTFIPYVGSLVGGALSIGLALFQYWGSVEGVDGTMSTDWLRIGIVAAVFGVGQFLEGNILTPKLVGKSVGLHPVWLIFALSAFGTLFGFVGLLVAVPVAAALGVLTRFALAQYQGSLLFQGKDAIKPPVTAASKPRRRKNSGPVDVAPTDL